MTANLSPEAIIALIGIFLAVPPVVFSFQFCCRRRRKKDPADAISECTLQPPCDSDVFENTR